MAKTRKVRPGAARAGSLPLGREQHTLGQYYTPTIVCDLICRLAITDPSCVVLDPACGDGEFLVAAMKRLDQIRSDNNTTQRVEPGCQVIGIEINGAAAKMARSRGENTSTVDSRIPVEVIQGDFFDIVPGTATFPATVAAVVGNPPYVRQELISDKERVRTHLSGTAIDERSDLYVYFFSRAEQWLADGGSIGFLTSERYLDTQYGTGLQQFLLDHFAIRAVIAFDKQLFSDALIGTVITILRKEPNEQARYRHLTRFLRVKRVVGIEAIAGVIEASKEHQDAETTDAWNLVLASQHALGQVTKWRPFLFAPHIYFELQQSPRLVELGAIATIKRGITSGANDFFYRRENELESLSGTYPGLKTYFRPLLKAIGQSDWMHVTPGDTDWYVLDVHHLVQECKSREGMDAGSNSGAGDLATRVKVLLKEMGHGILVMYIDAAEAAEAKPHSNATCAGRPIWFDLGRLLLGGIGFPKEYWTKFICPLVDEDVALDSRVYVVIPGEWPDVDPCVDKRKVLAALLNADLSAIFYECQGRVYAGQALDRASCMVYEAAKLRIVDPRQLSTASLIAIQSAFDKILAKERSLVPRKTRTTLFESGVHSTSVDKARRLEYIRLRQALNHEILAAIELGDRTMEIQANVQWLVESRRKRGWDDVQVLIERKT